MGDESRLIKKILSHWQEHCPHMVEDLRARGLLDNAIAEAESNTVDLLHKLLHEQKMGYQDAWEIATREWAFLPSEDPSPSSISNPKKSRAGTSG
jgi:hypothetical protein